MGQSRLGAGTLVMAQTVKAGERTTLQPTRLELGTHRAENVGTRR